MPLRQIKIALLLTLSTGVMAQVPAPLPADVIIDAYYPEASRRLNHMAKVVLRVGRSDIADELALRLVLVEGFEAKLFRPNRYADTEGLERRFISSAERLVKRLRFSETPKANADVRVSVLFLLDSCDQMKHDPTADYFITVCRDAVPAYPME